MTRHENPCSFKLPPMKRRSAVAPLAALGIVFGDIGTSPLYSVNELIHNTEAQHEPVGAISLVIWLLTIVICLKYIVVVLRADNEEQGGVFALLALISRHKAPLLVILGALLVFAAGLLLGDGVITPAISVLSAVEGLSVASPRFEHYTVPITLVILTALFALQSRGTHSIGKLFGPIMLCWFVFLGVMGATTIVDAPEILQAFNPINAIQFLDGLSAHHLTLALGSVVLVVTGGEALFADLGHIGKRPIRQAWIAVVYPALILNYLGQGAFELSGQTAINDNIFFSMVPQWGLYPAVILATLATVIASQALISGAFSLVAQGIALKYLPTMRVVHTHEDREGQLYIPLVNWGLFIGSAFLVVTFRSSSDLAAAYGLAVSADMVITSLAVAAVAFYHWRWKAAAVAAVFIPFGIIDGSLLLGNVYKIPDGGYIPLVIGAVMVTIMATWRWGRERVRLAFAELSTMKMSEFIELKNNPETPVFPRPMVLLTAVSPRDLDDVAPPLLELFYRRYGALPNHLVLLSISQLRTPSMPSADRYKVVEFQNDPENHRSLISISASFGFREQPDVEDVIADIIRNSALASDNLSVWMIHAAKERIVGAVHSGFWQKGRHELFKTLRRQAEPAYSYFGLDDDARLTVELVPVVI
jgi:KUP system potassium uptake protein